METVDRAIAAVQHKPDGSFNDEEVLAVLETLVPYDEKAARRTKAKAYYRMAHHHIDDLGHGQLFLPGLGPYNYERNKLISNAECTDSIRQHESTLPYKIAERNRVRLNADFVNLRLEQRNKEVEEFQKWVAQEAVRGRRLTELTFDNFVHESGFLQINYVEEHAAAS
jgi:hypothetical protein